MKVGIVGYRKFIDYDLFETTVKKWEEENGTIDVIVSGGAPGTDTMAKFYAEKHNKTFIVFPAEWKKYGRGAGPIRNKLIIENSDRLIAFLSPKSKGTQDSIKKAKKLNLKINVINI